MRLIQIAQHADDLERAAAFYSTLLHAKPTHSMLLPKRAQVAFGSPVMRPSV